MSLILILVYWILVPVLVGLVVMALWRRARTYFQRAAVVVLGVTTFSGFFWIAEGEKFFSTNRCANCALRMAESRCMRR